LLDPVSLTKSPTRSQVRIAVGFTALLLLAIVLSNTVFNDPLGFDFSAVYAAGLILRRGDSSKLYDLNEQAQVERGFGRNKLLVCAHPPFETIFFAPMTLLNYREAYVLWGAINVLLWLIFQHVMRPFSPVPKHPFHYLMLCSLFFPLWSALMQGQMSILLLVMFSLTFIELERRRDYRAGIFLGLGLFKFPVVLAFALICFLRGKWKLMMGFGTAALLLAGLSLIVVGPAGIQSYARMLTDATREQGKLAYATIKPWDMPTLTGFLLTYLGPYAGPRLAKAVAALFGGILLLVTARFWKRHEKRAHGSSSGLMFAAALAVSLVVAPYVNLHDLSLMLIAVLLVLGSSQRASGSPWARVLTACICILYVPPVYVLLLRHRNMSLLFPVLLCFAIAALLLAVNSLPRTASPQPGGVEGAVIASDPARNCDTC
jgi:Glycosyltransferase family 87